MSKSYQDAHAAAAAEMAIASAHRALVHGDRIGFQAAVLTAVGQLEHCRVDAKERVLDALIGLARACPPSRARDALLARAEALRVLARGSR